jgi:hypothetical protein
MIYNQKTSQQPFSQVILKKKKVIPEIYTQKNQQLSMVSKDFAKPNIIKPENQLKRDRIMTILGIPPRPRDRVMNTRPHNTMRKTAVPE